MFRRTAAAAIAIASLTTLLGAAARAADYNCQSGWAADPSCAMTTGHCLCASSATEASFSAVAAATATALAADPADCGSTEFATGINASGAAQCTNFTTGDGLDFSPPNFGLDLTELTCGAGIHCDGATEIEVLSTESSFLQSSTLTCDASGKAAVGGAGGPLEYCDSTPTKRYAAYGDSSGNSTAAGNDSVALTTDTTGNYVATVADGTGIDGTASAEGATYTPTLDLTEITCGAGISCSAATTIAVDSTELSFLTDAAASACGASTKGKAGVADGGGPIWYCDDTGTPVTRYTAYGNSSGESTAAASSSVVLTTDVSGTLPEGYGGTDQSAYTTGDILYSSSSNNLSKLAIGTQGKQLEVSSSGIPAWTGGHYARIYNSSNYTIANTTYTQLTFNSTREDTNSYKSGNNITIPTGLGGMYAVNCVVTWDTNTGGGVRTLYIQHVASCSGTATAFAAAANAPIAAGLQQTVTGLYKAAATDCFQCYVYQDSGGNRTITAAAAYSGEFAAAWVGQ